MWQGQQEAGAGPSAPRLVGPRWQARVLGAGRLGAGTLSFECLAPCEVVPGTVLLCPLCSASGRPSPSPPLRGHGDCCARSGPALAATRLPCRTSARLFSCVSFIPSDPL